MKASGEVMQVLHTTKASDEELVCNAALGDAAAFEAIMRRYNRLLFRTARAILKRDEEAEEALQEAYLRSWRALSSFRGEAKFSTWLVRIVMNEALARQRKRSGPVLLADMADGDALQQTIVDAEDAPANRPEQVLMRAQLRAQMERQIDALPDIYRSVFVLRAVEELSVEEVAEILELSAATVRIRFFRARGILRTRLTPSVGAKDSDAFSFDGARCDRIVNSVAAKLNSVDSIGPRLVTVTI